MGPADYQPFLPRLSFEKARFYFVAKIIKEDTLRYILKVSNS